MKNIVFYNKVIYSKKKLVRFFPITYFLVKKKPYWLRCFSFHYESEQAHVCKLWDLYLFLLCPRNRKNSEISIKWYMEKFKYIKDKQFDFHKQNKFQS